MLQDDSVNVYRSDWERRAIVEANKISFIRFGGRSDQMTPQQHFQSVCRFENAWETVDIWVVVSNIFYFHPYLGKRSNLTNIFQMGWNHHLGIDVYL